MSAFTPIPQQLIELLHKVERVADWNFDRCLACCRFAVHCEPEWRGRCRDSSTTAPLTDSAHYVLAGLSGVVLPDLVTRLA